jgi:predicted dehydrogenase
VTVRRTKIAVVGAGVMGSVYARNLTIGALKWRGELVGVVDTDESSGRRLADECGCPPFNSVDELFDVARPEAVYIAVPDHLHVEPFLACAERGAAILVEKPLATTVLDAVRMRDAALRAGIVAEVNFSNRFNPPFVRAYEAIRRGEVGDVIGINARLSNVIDYPTKMMRWADRTTCGWFLLSHLFDLVRWLTDAEAVGVTANGVTGKLASLGLDTYDLIQALVSYDSGATGAYESSWVLPPSLPSIVDCNVQILGTEGRVLIDTHSQMVQVAAANSLQYPGTLDWTSTRIAAFLDAVDGATPDPATVLGDGVANTALLVALHEAITSGAAVTLSADRS